MRFSIISILALALAVSASPLVARQVTTVADTTQVADGNQDVGNKGQNAGSSASNQGHVTGDVTIEQGVQTCGNAQLNCCNKIEKKGDTTSAGLLGSLFGSGDIGIQCSPINIPVAALQVPINKQCQANAACCQGEVSQNGLINLGCLALSSLL
ncbi:hypothetical protein B9Z19DRAFT_1149080 [Tuber borchii]|uniref:Hydrophobin n=1 Tax=Tuber borchii TaxID=42251 RepID=A0A2T6ZME0_TUBBO|nr:hypothetical protein B9Z19DRAFT_1149080 [Tuber borchii]